MLTTLSAYHGCRMIQLPKEDKTFGSGRLGAKSMWLEKCRGACDATMVDGDERTGIIYLPHISATPALFTDFLNKAGASHSNPKSEKSIMRTPLTPEIRDYVREVFALFPELNIIFRSDECTAQGVGLWHSGFALSNGEPDQIKIAETEIKKILASEYSADVKAFKMRTGLPLHETPGVLAMPVAGYRYPKIGGFAYTSLFHMNAITRFNGSDPLVHLGIGIGGGNSGSAISSPLSGLSSRSFSSEDLNESVVKSSHLVNGILTRDQEGIETVSRLLGALGPQVSVEELRRSFQIFDSRMGRAMYLELPFAAIYPVLAQAAPINTVEPSKPKIDNDAIILSVDASSKSRDFEQFGSRVSGRGVVHAERYMYLDETDAVFDMQSHNDKMKNYVLFLDGATSDLREIIPFAAYSNAAAIVIIDDLPRFSVASHMDGALREADIPVIVVKRCPSAIKKDSGRVVEQPLLVYANDAKEEAFVAITE